MTRFINPPYLLLATTAILAATSSTEAAVPKSCNGSPDYCRLPFDRFTFMGTHNSAAYRLTASCGLIKKCVTSRSMLGCFWENQSGHDIGTQLKNGIRLLDIDTCVNKKSVVTCHGEGGVRGIGDPLDVHIKQVKDFIAQNPNEVIVIEYGDYDGDKATTANAIIANLKQHLSGKMLERTDTKAPWPTLDEMTKQGKQVVVFFGRFSSDYLEGSWEYTRRAKNTNELVKNYKTKWQCIDYGYDATASGWFSDLFHGHMPKQCLMTTLYSSTYTRVHRVKIDYYYNMLEPFKAIIKDMNA
ncbi:PLC-like phosphodiesterase [Syncephalis fuscata]|nr:PLC-like phosphodiesterase [Syncephalis fuscata]